MKNLYAKLLEVQKKVGAIAKDSSNPFFKSKYFDINGLLEELKPVLNEVGLVVIQPLGMTAEYKPTLITKIADSESGEMMEIETALPEVADPQKFGAAVTYYRRYTLQSLFMLQAEDDDANSVSGENKAPAKTYPANDLPWLSEAALNEMKKFIAEGKGAIVVEKMKNYKMKTQYRTELLAALKNGTKLVTTTAIDPPAPEFDPSQGDIIDLDKIPF